MSQRTDLSGVKEEYLGWLRAHGHAVQALGWGSSRGQLGRFAQFPRGLTLKDKAVIDVGCGFADLFTFLKGIDQRPARYFGIDLVEAFIEQGRSRLAGEAGVELCVGGFPDGDFDTRTFDIGLASGTMNHDVPNRDNYIKDFLTRLWSMCTEAMAFNMESSYGAPHLTINGDPSYWLRFVSETFSPRVIYYADYHDADFTLIVRR